MVTRPGPGRPATLLIDEAPVGATQNTAPRVGFEASPIGVSDIPTAVMLLVPTSPVRPPVRKQLRLNDWQLLRPPPQSASVVHPRCGWLEAAVQLLSRGPRSHVPSPSPPSVHSRLGVLVSSEHVFDAVLAPGWPHTPEHDADTQEPPGHDELSVQRAPLFAPPWQFLPGHCELRAQLAPELVPPTQVPHTVVQVPLGQSVAPVQLPP